MVAVRSLSRSGTGTLALQLAAATTLALLGVLSVGPRPAALPLLYLAAVTPQLARIDIAEHRLPNRLVVPGVLIGLLAALAEWLTGGSPLVPLLAGACYPAFLLGLALLGGMGAGDVKLGAALGLASATPLVVLASPVLAFLLGGVVSAVQLAARGRDARIAFGPFMLAGFWCAVGLAALEAVTANLG